MLIDTIHAHRDELVALAQQYGARRLRVFGSVARREEGPDSDVDFLVDFPAGYDLFRQRIPLSDRLAEFVGRKVDLIPEHELNKHIHPYVLQEAVDL